MRCDRCVMLMIQGVPCHETGCPNAGREWVDGEWVIVAEDEDADDDYGPDCERCGGTTIGGECVTCGFPDNMADPDNDVVCECDRSTDPDCVCPTCEAVTDSDLLAEDDRRDAR